MPDPFYIVGIDLGTTNSVVAYTRVAAAPQGKSEIQIFEVPQFVGTGAIQGREILPSFIYLPGEHDVAGAKALPWDSDSRTIIGEYARERGAELPQRLIASTKSWLCNPMIDRNAPVLPWASPENILKLSPVEASAAILWHIRDAWNHVMASDDEKLVLEKQEVFLTVPASFDAVARELTVKGAEMAGLANITLLEEPQAAFYSWINRFGDRWRKNVRKGDLILVCDIGGGTSDFSLIQVSEERGELVLERIAVGDHLLIGGDNMDLAIAYFVAQKLAASGTRLDPWQMRMLVYSCRTAKEKLLSDADETGEYPVTILGRGSSLIGGTIKTALTRADIEGLIVDGFFPKCDLTSMPQKAQTMGLKETGLSYEADPAATRHLARFLNRQTQKTENKSHLPTAVLFNGGVMKSRPIRQRIMDLVDSWNLDKDKIAIREIESGEFDLSVARGAVYYGLARRGEGIRIRGGLGKSYYIGVAASMPAVPNMPAPVKALCVAPFGMEEGSDANLKSQEFNLVVGEPVRFEFYSSSIRKKDGIGSIIEEWQDQLEETATLETTLDGPAGSMIRVTIEIRVTEIGTLELWCVSVEEKKKWKLEFNVREQD